jgi:putative ABC transport system permease protein
MATLALVIGLNTAIFSVVHTVLFRPIAYPAADRLVWLGDFSERERRDIHVGRGSYRAWREQARSFEAITGYGNDQLALVSGGEASQESIASITGDFWSITGAQPALGRLFGESEPDVIVLSWALFQRRFGGDSGAIGRPVTVNGHPFSIVGVLSKDFRFAFPKQYDDTGAIEAYIPIPTGLLNLPHPAPVAVWEPAVRRLGPSAYALHVVARLRPGVPLETAAAEMQAIYAQEARMHPGIDQDHRSFHFAKLQDKVAGKARRALLVLLGAGGFVLLIACVNVANLLLTRAAGRRREMAIRAALGARKRRVLRQSIVESLLLSTGGLAGIALARWMVDAIRAIAPYSVPRLSEAVIDAPVMWFTAGVSLLTGLLFGLGPAFVVGGANVHEVLKAEASAASARRRARTIELLVAAELALAIILLTGAGLLLKSFWRMNARPAGFTPEKIVVMRITLSGPEYGSWPPKQAYTEEMLRRVRSAPGVEAAGILSGTMNTSVRVDGSDGTVFAAIRGVSSGYLKAMGARLVRGSWPAEGSLFGVVVNEAFARQTGGDAAGRHIGGFILNETITGVVQDFKTSQLDADPLPEVYVPYERLPVNRSMRVAVRAAGPVEAVAPLVRERVQELDPTQPVYEFQTLEHALSDSVAPRRFNLFLLFAFAATAVLLGVIGIYGAMAYSVTQRTREIGVRLALGGRPSEIALLVVREGMQVALLGMAVGMVGAAAATKLIAGLLYDVQPHDVPTFVAVAVVFGLTALAACVGPAVRAARVDPIVALRYE